jgi:hypothetical protein
MEVNMSYLTTRSEQRMVVLVVCTRSRHETGQDVAPQASSPSLVAGRSTNDLPLEDLFALPTIGPRGYCKYLVVVRAY